MRFLLALALCSWHPLAQSHQEADSSMSCVERLEMPIYPALARAARVVGVVTATVAVSPGGPIQVTTSAGGHLLLTAAVETAIRASTFQASCTGKSVRLIFNFGLDSNPAKRVSYGYPNQFWISALPPPPGLVGAP